MMHSQIVATFVHQMYLSSIRARNTILLTSAMVRWDINGLKKTYFDSGSSLHMHFNGLGTVPSNRIMEVQRSGFNWSHAAE